jgi:methionyl-tRNA formyltransferase
VKIIFLGTPDFAVASLQALIENGMQVVAAVTAPDKPAGRGMKLQQSAVKKYAVEKNIPVLQPEKLKSPEFLDELRSYHADVQVVVAFRMLPEVVWNMPPLGTINVHASLLPNYRGAAPINWAIINGEKETGVTTFKLQHEIDTGHILLQSTVGITEQDTAGTLHDKLMTAGAALIVDTLHQVEKGHVAEKPQIVLHDYKHAPKLFTETCLIDWNHTTEHVYNLIRGLSPYPAAFTIVNDKKMKLFLCSKIIHTHQLQPGTLLSDNKHSIRFACTDGFIEVNELQLEGKTRMKTDDFLRGNKIV